MKKLMVLALATLAGCTYYDYYNQGIRYTQDGVDCIYYADETGRYYSDYGKDVDNSKKIVYRNTRCADLYARDNAGKDAHPDRVTYSSLDTAPYASTTYIDATMATPSCGCANCGATSNTRQYVLVPAN